MGCPFCCTSILISAKHCHAITYTIAKTDLQRAIVNNYGGPAETRPPRIIKDYERDLLE